METSSPNIHMAGVPIHFPHIPYRAQNALMHSVVTSIRKQQHALIESPTGTGKSLALLCSSLATQQYLAEEQGEVKCEKQKQTSGAMGNDKHERSQEQTSDREKELEERAVPSEEHSDHNCDSDDSDFAPRKRFRNVSWQKPISRKLQMPRDEEKPENTFMFQRLLAQRDNPLDEPDDDDGYSAEPTQKPPKRIPRIFYATRTHNQVAQVIGELRKTVYRPRISILASRREYCVHELVRSHAMRDEACKGLVKTGDCQFYHNASDLATHEDLRDEVWDIEELNELGRKHGGCPYYASHELYQSAQLILCPYNFLVHPIVRAARGVNLSGDIVILDEAHNIESYAREAVGFEGNVADIRRGTAEVEEMISTGSLAGPVGDLITAYRNVKYFLECFLALSDVVVNSPEFRQHESSESAVYERGNLLEKLERVAVTSANVKKWRGAHDYIINFGGSNETKRKKTMMEKHSSQEDVQAEAPDTTKDSEKGADSVQSKGKVNDRNASITYGYGGAMTSASEADVVENMEVQRKDLTSRNGRPGRTGRRIGRRRKPATQEETPWVLKCLTIANELLTTLEYLFGNPDDFTLVFDRRTVDFVTTVTFQIHCLSAAVCFRDISSKARSVIVTSGTLSPVGSFAGELGTNFAIAKTLPHVIDVRKQLFVGIAGHGPRGIVLDATYHGSAKFAFQDSLGDALIDYCRVIPGGVLIFFPSYRMMDQLRGRWRASGVLEQLETIKEAVLFEPNKRGEDFDTVVAAYDAASRSDGRGAVLVGVCRGKFSEGIDFRDSTSRAVIIIGIPFPHKGDVVVNRKQCWNNRSRSEKKRKELQSGMEWYEMQAFQALNQAVGRTVRHRYDYGAILLIDCRFQLRRMIRLLPEWTKASLQTVKWSHESLVRNLQGFYNNVQDRIAAIAAEDGRYAFPSVDANANPTFCT